MASTLGALVDEGQQHVQVAVGALAAARAGCRSPRRHPAALEPAAQRTSTWLRLQHLDRVAADLRLVVLHEAGLKTTASPPGTALIRSSATPTPRRSRGRTRAGASAGGPQVFSMNQRWPPCRFIWSTSPPLARAACRRRRDHPGTSSRRSDALLARLHRPVAVHQLGEVELEGVLVPRRVRALHLAQLALEAVVHHRRGLASLQRGDLPSCFCRRSRTAWGRRRST
jgi:hypothetical protein